MSDIKILTVIMTYIWEYDDVIPFQPDTYDQWFKDLESYPECLASEADLNRLRASLKECPVFICRPAAD